MASSVVQYPLGPGGPNQKLAQEMIDPNASLLDVQNGVFDHDGAIEKRLGISALTTTTLAGSTAMQAPVKLLSRQAELLATDGDGLYSYASDGTPGWSNPSLMIPCQATRAPAMQLPVNAGASFCFADGNGRRVYWWRDSANLPYYAMQSIASGAWIVPPTLVSAAALVMTPIALYESTTNTFYLFCVSFVAGGASHNQSIFGFTVTGSGVISSAQPIVTDCFQSTNTYPRYDAAVEVNGGPGIVLFYGQSDADAASSSPRYLRLEALPAFTISASAVLESYQGLGQCVCSCACRYDGTLGVVWLVWQYYSVGFATYTVRAICLTTAWANVSAAFSITTLSGYVAASSGAAILAVEPLTVNAGAAGTLAAFFLAAPPVPGGPVVSLLTQGIYAANGSTPGANAGVAQYPNCTLVGRPFRYTVGTLTRCYIVVQMSETNVATSPQPQFSSTYVMDTMCMGTTTAAVRPRVVSVLAPRQSSYQAYGVNQLVDCRAANPTGIGAPTLGTYRFPVAADANVEFSQQNSLGSSFRGAYSVWTGTCVFSSAASWQYCEGNSESFVSSGVPSYYDGEQLAELSYFSWPVVYSATQNTSGALATTGVYEYAFCWAQSDATGQIHRSAFWSQSVTLTGSNTGVLWSVQDLPFTARYNRTSPPVLEMYRSQNAGTVLYFEGLVQSNASTAAYATPLSIQSSLSDTNIALQSLQYTTGGVLDSVCPPSFRCIIRHVDRLWGIDDTGLNIWYTTAFNAAVAPYFNESLTLSFTEQTLTALASMDDKLVAFSADEIWYIEGYGPAPTGLGSDLTVAVKVPTDTGAADWRSVVTVPTVGEFQGGVFFQSSRNGLIYLLDRGLTVTCVGKVVQDWFVSAPGIQQAVVLSASTVALTTQIRFVLSTGFVATYDYVQEAWSRQFYPTSLLYAVSPNDGPWSACGSDGYVYQELLPTSGAPYLDTVGGGGATWITTVVSAATVRPSGGLQSAMQVDYMQGVSRFLDACDIHVQAVYDYGPTVENWTFTYANMAAQSGGLALWRASPSAVNSQPMAISVTLSDALPTGGTATTGQGVRWLGLAYSFSTIGNVYDKLGTTVRQ